MTFFLTGTCADTADDLDFTTLNIQIKNCDSLIAMIEDPSKWVNHPCNFMYKDYIEWVEVYRDCLDAYKNKDYGLCLSLSYKAETIKPEFICTELYNHCKQLLYTKDPKYYYFWSHLGQTFVNYYYIDGNWWKYENDTKEIDNNFIKKPFIKKPNT